MTYYLINYKIQSENSRIAIPLGATPDINLLKLEIATVRNVHSPESIEINDYKQVTEDVFNLISPFINSSLQENIN